MAERRDAEGSGSASGRGAQALTWAAGIAGAVLAAVLSVAGMLEAPAAAALASASVLLALLLAAVIELRARDHLRTAWLERRDQLTADLAAAVAAPDPAAAVSAAATRARADLVAPRVMDDERDAFLRSVAEQCAQAHDRIALALSQQRARDDLDLLARAVPRLAASLDVDRVTQTIKELVVPRLADECELRVVAPGSHLAAEPSPEADHTSDETSRVVPLRTNGRLVGELVLRRTDGPVTDPDLGTVMLLAEPAARALDHAVRFSDEVHASATLQGSLLPLATLPVQGLEVATRYLAATEGQAVGGDFYDLVRSDDDRVVLVVGDVQGKGIEAAALTSTARHTLRAAALSGVAPAMMLRQLNEVLLYADAERTVALGAPSVRFVTAAVVALSRSSEEGFIAQVASGGHPPPLVIRTDGTVDQITVEGTLLGIFEDARYHECEVSLGLSDTLVLYTDGVTERRHQPELFDEAQLGRLVRNQLTDRHADAVAQLILDTVVSLSSRDTRDDIALLVARVTALAPA